MTERTADDARIDLQARSQESAKKSLRERMIGREGHVRDRWMTEQLAVEDRPVVAAPADVYRLPAPTLRFLSAAVVAEMHELLDRVRVFNERVEGLRMSQADMVLNADPDLRDLELRFRAWADRYVAERVSKPNNKDAGSPLRKYHRIYEELLSHLESVAFREGSSHRCAMGEFCDYLPWSLFRRTWSGLVDHDQAPGSLRGRFRVLLPDPVERQIANHMMVLYAWAEANDLERVLERILPASGTDVRVHQTDPAACLASLAQDMLDMRPFLGRNFGSDKTVLEVADRTIVSWVWHYGGPVGIIPVAESVEEMLDQVRKSSFSPVLCLHPDGQLAPNNLPWITLSELAARRPELVAPALRVVEALHARLVSFYDKVDIGAILDRYRERARTAPAETPTDEEVAATCQVIAESEPEPGEAPTLDRRLPSVRSQRLFAILSDRLGCEVRSGKGSEIVIWRPGGHHFRLGHHKRNAAVPSPVIKSLLEHVGISFGEWLAAVTR